ncbi:hypothetical protein FB382_002975 [Nocardioides ginsengisegetis]|uniref:Uncharacterized protein n=1 Tax=Nocardioides ginsengisegetis TaxID=661491 RepID=A0A7W3J202_9ACTN|nr:hypothetical protein [Nocardioides ginsengisegetis]MBA8804684.1 hypothetical protein [Nocardioides ginsengisegetis]
MLIRIAAVAVLLAALAGCGGGTPVAHDPGSDPSGPPTAIPAADGPVRTRNLVTVMDTGTGSPVVCLGAVAESWPPQCSGPALVDWDWSQHQAFERSGDVRWGSFALTGTFDGSSMTVTQAIAAALYDPMAPDDTDEPGFPGDNGTLDPKAADVQRRLEAEPLPGTLTVTTTPAGVTVEVVHDDGTLQQYVDRRYGTGTVTVLSALVPVG